MIDELAAKIYDEQRAVDRLVGEAKAVGQQGKDLQETISRLEKDYAAIEKAIVVLQSFGESKQQELQSKIETLVTHGLQTIFGDDLHFRIKTSYRGKLSAMDFEVVSNLDGVEVATPVLDSRGGGVAAVAGFIIRLILLLLFKDKTDPILVLDESFAQVSQEYVPTLAEFIRELVDKTRVQIILVTHSDGYSAVADRVYRFTLKDGRTTISEES